MAYLPHIGAACFALLALAHLVYTLIDLAGPPRYFRPRDRALLDAMRATHTALAPRGRDFWTCLMGFHLSHSIGVLVYALLIVVADGFGAVWLKMLVAAVGLVYTAIAWRFWFHIPFLGCALGTALIVAGWAAR